MVQRHENNRRSNFFVNSLSSPTVEELKEAVSNGDDKFINALQNYSSSVIKGSDSYWREKTQELKSWIDFLISDQVGAPDVSLTFSCVGYWWDDLKKVFIVMERLAGNTEGAEKIELDDCVQISKTAKNYPLLVDQFFMIRADEFMKTVVRTALGTDHYWGRVKFSPDSGDIYLHVLAITNKKNHQGQSQHEKVAALSQIVDRELRVTMQAKIVMGWQANCDIRLLNYNSGPLQPTFDEIEAVVKEIYTDKQEKEQIRNIIKG